MKSNLALRLALAGSLLMLGAAPACADGTLTHMSGSVSILKADGKTAPAAPGAKAYAGDTVVTGAGGYVRMEMTDGGEVVLRPDSQLKIEGYKFVEAKPAEDSFIFSVLRGGMRTVTGLVGKRGNKDAYELKTETATVGIRGTQFDLRVCQANCGALADGTYLAVRFGAVQTSNAQGSLPVAAGQVAHVPAQRPPVMLPRDPGIGFTPPPVIPKLDEKKKVQSSAAAASPPEQPKPAASSQTASAAGKEAAKAESSEKSESSGKSDTSGKNDASGKSESGKADSSGKSESTKAESTKAAPAEKAEPAKADASAGAGAKEGGANSSGPAAPSSGSSSQAQGSSAGATQQTSASPTARTDAPTANPPPAAAAAPRVETPAAPLFASPSAPAGGDCSIQ